MCSDLFLCSLSSFTVDAEEEAARTCTCTHKLRIPPSPPLLPRRIPPCCNLVTVPTQIHPGSEPLEALRPPPARMVPDLLLGLFQTSKGEALLAVRKYPSIKDQGSASQGARLDSGTVLSLGHHGYQRLSVLVCSDWLLSCLI